MKTLYLAGPMRGKWLYNFSDFMEAANKLRQAGYRVLNPAEMDHGAGFNEYYDTPDDEFLRAAVVRDRAAIDRSDGVALLDGWDDSEGARDEVAYAAYRETRCATVEDWLKSATTEENADGH